MTESTFVAAYGSMVVNSKVTVSFDIPVSLGHARSLISALEKHIPGASFSMGTIKRNGRLIASFEMTRSS